jgi:hypothetical protein
MVVDQIDTDGERMLGLCCVHPTRCNRLPLGHLTHGEPEIALLEFGECGVSSTAPANK